LINLSCERHYIASLMPTTSVWHLYSNE